jgi:proline iminopeptidase
MNKTKKNRSKVSHDEYANTKLFPPIKPLTEEHIKVSSLHNVVYWTYGNPNGKPVLFIHGGPGAGTNPNCARFFDPSAYYIVLVDQRGCGKSKPTAELRENTTFDLIQDFEKIREKLNISKWQLFGGSWGSTLSLAYAIAHPDKVTELVIRGIFLIRQSEIDWFINPKGTESNYPDTYESFFLEGIPKSERKEDVCKMDLFKIYGKCFNGDFGKNAKNNALLCWCAWETSVSHLKPTPPDEIVRDYKKSKAYVYMSAIEHHYFSNKGFFKNDNYFLEKENIDKIKDIPTTIVQGRYDVLCPIISAYELHKQLPHAKFHATIAGHSAFDEDNISKLVDATNMYKKRI